LFQKEKEELEREIQSFQKDERMRVERQKERQRDYRREIDRQIQEKSMFSNTG